jgi:hypothetical protein
VIPLSLANLSKLAKDLLDIFPRDAQPAIFDA